MNKKIRNFLRVALVIALFITSRGALAADVNLTIRDGSSIVFTGTVALPTSITSLDDADSSPHTIDASSVLAVLASADETSADFSISNLTYFSSFGSLYLKCITDASGEKCDDWQYTVSDTYPGIGMDQNILSGGENVYVYFGPQNKVSLSSDSITTAETLTVTAQKYDYQNDGWVTRDGVTVGLTQPNPDDPFSPTEIQTAPVDANGQAIFSAIPEGSYGIGIKEDFYFPLKTLTVTSTPTPPPAPSSSGGGSRKKNSGSVLGVTTEKTFDLKKALDFLVTQQKENGSFEEDLYTDWVSLALAPANYQGQIIKLIKYLGESKIEGPLVTDFERRAMALMALGLNPYNTNGENYIEKIIKSFDGKQFGDLNEDNDDIFALIVLQNAGYAQEEKMISDDLAFILGRQRENGSWDESVDMTGAAIEALAVFEENTKVKDALQKAKDFLKKTQNKNGGWNDSASSTAWAIGGILALGENPGDWKNNEKSPLDYLATIQDTDGGIKNLIGETDQNIKNKIWQTAYVASALSGKTWNQIMQKFNKHEAEVVAPIIKKPIKKPAIKKVVVPKVTPTEAPLPVAQPEIPEKSWFKKLLEKIF